MTNQEKAQRLDEIATHYIQIGMKDAALLRECAAMMRERGSVTEYVAGKVMGHYVRICRCEGYKLPKQPYMWAVRWLGNVVGKSGDIEHDPTPSSRNDEFYAEYRFDSLEAAQAAAVAWVDGQEGEP